MNTIDQLKRDRVILQDSIKTLLCDFEDVYGQDLVSDIRMKRYNGSNNAYGKISEIKIGILVPDF